MKKPLPLLVRFLALWLILSLSLPSPAFAMRQLNAGAEEGHVDDELAAALHGISPAARSGNRAAAGAEEEIKQLLQQAVDSPGTIPSLQRVFAHKLERLEPAVRNMLDLNIDGVTGFSQRLAPQDPFLYAVALWIQETRDRNPDYLDRKSVV